MEVHDNGLATFLTDAEVEAKKALQDAKKESIEKRKSIFTALLDNHEGIEFLKELKRRSNYENSSLLLSQDKTLRTDPYRLAYFDGMREMFIEILSLIDNKLLIKILENGATR